MSPGSAEGPVSEHVEYKAKLRSNPRPPQRFVTLQEAMENDRISRARNIVVMPPDNGDSDVASDEGDDSSDDDEFPEPVGEVEVDEYSSEEDEEDESEDRAAPNTWRKHNAFRQELPSQPCESLEESHPELFNKTEFEIWKEVFDEKITEHIRVQTLLYARRDCNIPQFALTSDDLNNFFGILLLSGYHSLPFEAHYWSHQPDLGVPLVASCMTRNRFWDIKWRIHLADNHNLEKGNKLAKVSPLYTLLNNNLKKFGIFHADLSIDESMVPYYGHHSSKMFIRGKPVRVGYKVWTLTSSDGFPYALTIYQGMKGKTAVGTPKTPLGTRVVTELLAAVTEMSTSSKHTVYFDNYFTSYDLLCELHQQGFKATGTIRSNRSGGAHKVLIPDKELHKKPRGTYDYRCDGKVFVVKWHDNSIVSLASNIHTHSPEQTANRRVGKNIEHVPQPMIIRKYNSGMGGVDVFDRLLGQYRPSIRGKKWWWPLFIHAINVSVVAAWKIFLVLHPRSHVSHLDFRRNVALCLLKKADSRACSLRAGVAHLPVDVRHDGVGHTHTTTTEGRCVVCHINTKNECHKCKVRLHYARGKNCFELYHNNL